MGNTLNIALAQINPIVGNLTYNRDKILEVWSSVREDTDLVVFSELVISGYPPEDLILKPFFMQKVSNALNDIVLKSKESIANNIQAHKSCGYCPDSRVTHANLDCFLYS